MTFYDVQVASRYSLKASLLQTVHQPGSLPDKCQQPDCYQHTCVATCTSTSTTVLGLHSQARCQLDTSTAQQSLALHIGVQVCIQIGHRAA